MLSVVLLVIVYHLKTRLLVLRYGISNIHLHISMVLGMENIQKIGTFNFQRHPALIVLLRTFRKCIFFLGKKLFQQKSGLSLINGCRVLSLNYGHCCDLLVVRRIMANYCWTLCSIKLDAV